MVTAFVGTAGATQTPQGSRSPGTEARLLADGWMMLASGKTGEAAFIASRILNEAPNSSAALSLLIDAELTRADAMAALTAYEGWLGTRRLDEAYVLRRIALGALLETSATTDPALVAARLKALAGLAADGNVAASERLTQAAFAGGLAETRALAAEGDERAINILIARLGTMVGNKSAVIAGLAESKSRTPIPALRKVLTDQNDVNRAAAADALGRLGATDAREDLRALLDDPVFPVKLAAAGALQRLQDGAGIVFLQEIAASEHGAVRMAAARAHGPSDSPWWQDLVRSLATDPDPVVRLDSAKLIAPYDPALARGIVDALLRDDNIAIRQAAGQVLAEEIAGDFATLRGLLRATDLGLRVAAATRILELTRNTTNNRLS
jgi:HEAT repeat protein